MENIFVEFLPPWVETGLQPAFYDKESGTVLQQTARMYARVNMLIRMFNKLSKNTKEEVERFETSVNETVENYIEQFNQLHDYVHDYFDNLDVQEEINNKLDDMLEQGTLQEIITAYIQSSVVWTFDTIADMKLATNLIDGSYAQTLGFYNKDDCGGARYKIRTKTGEDVVDDHILFDLYDNTLVAEYVPQTAEVYVKQFGAKGDSTTDDTAAIQACIDYCIEKSLICVINSTLGYYKTTLPIILKTNRTIDTGYWTSSASKVVGEHHGNCRIVKIGDSVHTDNPNPSINNVNATFIACNPTNSAQTVTGIYIDELSLENYTNTSGDKTAGSYGLWTNISRSTYMNLNIKAYRGIYAYCFSCKFENIVYSCVENAMELDNGTSNFFRFMYASNCNNPYKIRSSYSTLMNVCGDACTGTIFELRSFGLTLENCGCESPRAQYIFQTKGYVNNIKISNFVMNRQTGDSENGLSVNDCSVIKMHDSGYVEFDCFSVLEGSYIGEGNNSYFFEVGSATITRACTSLKNFCYYKNYTGTDNPRMLLWRNRPALNTVQRYANPTMEFNYIVSPTNKIYPMIGGYQPASDTAYASALNSNDISYTKTIRLDVKDQYHNGANDDMRYSGATNVGDLFLYNDPKGKNALGYTVGTKDSSTSWSMNQIPIILSGSTADRPTTNLFNGLCYFDTTLGKPIWRSGSSWKDASGTTV